MIRSQRFLLFDLCFLFFNFVFQLLRASALKEVFGMPMNTYLFLAFAAVWVIFMLYAWLLWLRQARLQRELEDLKSRLQEQPPAGQPGR